YMIQMIFFIGGVILWFLTSISYFFLGTRPQDDQIDKLRDDLTEAESYLKKRILDYNLLVSRYEFERDLLNNLLSAEKIDRAKVEEQEKIVTERKELVDNFYRKIIKPCKKEGKKIPPVNAKGKIIEITDDNPEIQIQGVKKIKTDIKTKEKNLVRQYAMPMVSAIVFFVIFVLYLIATKIDKSGNFVDGWTLVLTISLGIIFATIATLSHEVVEEDTQAIKMFLHKAYQRVGRGDRTVIPGIMSLRKFPTTRQFFDLPPDPAWITGTKEPQRVKSDLTIVWWIDEAYNAISTLGLDFSIIKKKLEGDPDKENDRGMIRASAGEAIRAYMADPNKVGGLMKALQSRESLGEAVLQTLTDDIGYMGIGFELSKVPDIIPQEQVAKEIDGEAAANRAITHNEKAAKALVAAAVGKKLAEIEDAKAKSKTIELTGAAEASKRLAMGSSEANIVGLTLKAQIDNIADLEDKEGAKAALPIIYALLVGDKSIQEAFKALQGMNLNIVAIPELKNILGPLAGLFKTFMPAEVK
ncbi:MAG TPA: hypothetical protein ENL09_02390, partial [Bacteroidetes bacterium]|nr:hypothetical protein [Bacteroidota bacterium]